MIVSEKMHELGSKRSTIRELFEYGKQRAAVIGSENVYDFSLGNPTVPAPSCVNEVIRSLTEELDSLSLHGYTSAQGDQETRQAIAGYLNRTYDTSFKAEDFYMTVGAAAALCICFRALTSSADDEFIALAPYFPEYKVFVNAAGASLKVVSPDTQSFQINFEELLKTLTPHTRGVIINSPNNPSGAVYSAQTIEKLASILEEKSKEFGRPVYIITDEPYREIVYDGVEVPFVTKYYKNTLVCYSYSKSLSLPGERIGYVLVPAEADESREIYAAVCGAGRALGYVCAPSMMQKVIARCTGQTGNILLYKENRDLLYEGLTELGYKCFKPQGAFYMFVQALELDADAFCEQAKKLDLLLVPATDFGCPGYVRISYCVDTDMIKRSFGAFRKLKDLYDSGNAE